MEQLVEQAKIGDRQSLNTLYSRFRQRALSICCHITRDKELSEELADDAFLIAFSKLDRLNDPEKFDRWLAAISTRLALRQLKRQSENKVIPISQIEGFDVPCETHEPPLTSEELQAAVDQLPMGYRQVFTMAVIEGRPHKEIAEALNIEPHSSSSQLYHARVMLRRILAPLICFLLVVMPFFIEQDQRDDIPQLTAYTPKVSVVWPQVVLPNRIPSRNMIKMQSLPTVTEEHTISDNKVVEITDKRISGQVDIRTIGQLDIQTTSQSDNQSIGQLDNLVFGQSDYLRHSNSKWSMMVAMTRSLSGERMLHRPHALLLPAVSTVSMTEDPTQCVLVSNWRDCKQYVLENSMLFSDEVAGALMRIAQSNEIDNNGEIIRTEYHEPPTTVAVTLHYAIDSTFTVFTGICHGVYRSYFQTGVGKDRIDERQSVEFLNIPLGMSYNIPFTPRFGCHLSADCSLQLPLSFHSSTFFVLGGQLGESEEVPIFEQSASENTPTFTTGLKLGVHYHLTKHVGLFAEGGVCYTINRGQTIVTYSTVRPVTFSTQVGLRFEL